MPPLPRLRRSSRRTATLAAILAIAVAAGTGAGQAAAATRATPDLPRSQPAAVAAVPPAPTDVARAQESATHTGRGFPAAAWVGVVISVLVAGLLLLIAAPYLLPRPPRH